MPSANAWCAALRLITKASAKRCAGRQRDVRLWHGLPTVSPAPTAGLRRFMRPSVVGVERSGDRATTRRDLVVSFARNRRASFFHARLLGCVKQRRSAVLRACIREDQLALEGNPPPVV